MESALSQRKRFLTYAIQKTQRGRPDRSVEAEHRRTAPWLLDPIIEQGRSRPQLAKGRVILGTGGLPDWGGRAPRRSGRGWTESVSGNGNRGRCTRKVVKSKVWWFGFRTSPAIRALSWAKIAFRGYPGVTLWVSRLATWCGVTPQPNERRAKATRSKASAFNLEWRMVPSTQYHSPSIGAVAKTRWSARLLSTVFPKLGCHPGRVASEANLLEYSRLAVPCQRPSAHRQQKSWGA